MKIPSVLASAALFFPFAFGFARGAIVLTDNFTYANGSITSASGSPWVNHSGTAGQADIASNQLALTSSDTEDVSAPLSGQPYTSGLLRATFSVTFTTLPGAVGGYFAHFKNSGTGQRSRLTSFTTGAASGLFRLGISNDGGATVVVPTDLSLNTIYSVVMTWNLATSQSSLSVNGGTAVTDTDAASAITVTSFAFRQDSGIGTMTVDNLSVDYVPEPATTLLGSLGLLGLLRRRR